MSVLADRLVRLFLGLLFLFLLVGAAVAGWLLLVLGYAGLGFGMPGVFTVLCWTASLLCFGGVLLGVCVAIRGVRLLLDPTEASQ